MERMIALQRMLIMILGVSVICVSAEAAEFTKILSYQQLLRKIEKDTENLITPADKCELVGFVPDTGGVVKGGSGNSPHNIRFYVPENGEYYVGIVMMDDGDGVEQLSVSHNDVKLGTIVAGDHNGGYRFFVLRNARRFAKGDVLTLTTGPPVGYYRIAKIAFIRNLPELPSLGIRDVSIFPQKNAADKWDIHINWTTDTLASARVEYRINDNTKQVIQDDAMRKNHRAVLAGIQTGASCQFRIIADDGETSVASDEYFCTPGAYRMEKGTVDMKEIELSVSERTEHSRLSWYVSSGIPFPDGELASEKNAILIDSSGQPVIAQLDPLVRWESGSVKWLLVTFMTSTEAGADQKYQLRYGNDIQAVEWEPAFNIEESGIELKVYSDELKFSIFGGKLNLLNKLQFAGRDLLDNVFKPGMTLIDGNGMIYYGDTAETVKVEENGAIRTTIRLEGHYTDSWDKELFRYIVRLQCYRDFPGVLVSFTVGNDNLEQRMTDISGLSLIERHTFPDDAQVYMGGQWFPATESASLIQYDDNRFQMDAPSPTSGERAKGILTVKDKEHGLSFAMRDFWQSYPSGISAFPSEIRVDLLPELATDQYEYIQDAGEKDMLYYWFDEGRYKLSRGVQISHDMLIYVHDPDDPYMDNPDILADHFQNPIFAVAEPQIYCASGAIGEIDPRTEGVFVSYTHSVEEGFRLLEERRQNLREYGFMNYGDWYGERKYNWGNIEYDLQWCMALHFMWSGDLKYLWRGHQAAFHNVHIDTIHYDEKPDMIGRVHIHCLGHTGGYFPAGYKGMSAGFADGSTDYGHTFIQGNYAYYVLTGDRRFLEASEKTARQIAEYRTQNYDFGIERSGGWPLIDVMAAYNFTGDPYYLNAARIFIRHILDKQDEERGIWPAPIWECKHEPKHYGGKPFAMGILFKGMIMYDVVEPSEEVKQSIVKASQGIIREMWSEKDNGFYYAGCPSFMKKTTPGYTTALISQGLAYAYRYSGDEAIKNVLLNGLGPAVQKVGGFGKSYAQIILNTPYTLHDMRSWGLTELPNVKK